MYTGMGMYAFLCSAVLACLIVGTYTYIPFDCAELTSYSHDLLGTVTNPVSQGFKKTQAIVGGTTDFLSQDIGEIVFGEKYVESSVTIAT